MSNRTFNHSLPISTVNRSLSKVDLKKSNGGEYIYTNCMTWAVSSNFLRSYSVILLWTFVFTCHFSPALPDINTNIYSGTSFLSK